MLIARELLSALKASLQTFPAAGLLGPRQVGKTTLAVSLADLGDTLYLDLESPSDRQKLSEPELFFQGIGRRLVILDEIHRAPDLFQVLRGIIDANRRAGWTAGQFLLLGSASVELLRQSAESLAGRIAYVELAPFCLTEVAEIESGHPERLWLRGGFPSSYLATADAASLEWRNAFIRTYIEHDIPSFGTRTPSETLRRFWEMLGHSQGQTLNLSRLAANLGVSGQSVARYLDTLVDLLLVRRLQPWHANQMKRLVRSPKVYIRDSGLTHALLRIPDRDTLLGHPIVGASWEGYVIENILNKLPSGAMASFYRTSAGAEIDLILDFGRERWAIEIKRSLGATRPSKGFHLAAADIEATRRLVIYPGDSAYPGPADVEVVPLLRIMKELESR